MAEERQKELTVSWLKERDELKKELTEVKKAREKADRDLRTMKKARDTMVRRRVECGAGSAGGQATLSLWACVWCVLGCAGLTDV